MLPATKLVGISAQYNSADLNLERLWSAFRPYRNSIANQVGNDAFGIYECYEEHDDDVSFSYICAVAVSNFEQIPKGMATRELPEQLYAKFTHKGPIANLDHTLKYIWGTWLPKSGYEYVEKPDFELYSPRLTPQGPERILYLHIPVIKKS